ncbi:hypothetical protein conserved [Leishmania donovani]|uniref:Hypothetical_protein_conserved n=1 Tax=Leishmania donovani TaxID=5661 RepID=A0A504Y7K0_LEIDO|nr:hypothetical protein CGC20_37515 [Leishmania donovani]CAJ1987906.1 hypothetical protein conserved [Leishmania donovani]VDZ43793.1 hypothetical_protein_conserved [Leishmania donovani]
MRPTWPFDQDGIAEVSSRDPYGIHLQVAPRKASLPGKWKKGRTTTAAHLYWSGLRAPRESPSHIAYDELRTSELQHLEENVRKLISVSSAACEKLASEVVPVPEFRSVLEEV